MDIYFSPHPDDAILSCGGRLIFADSALVVNVFAGEYQTPTEWDKLCGIKSAPMKRRKDEDRKILNSIGVEVVNLNFLDVAARDKKNSNQKEDLKVSIIQKVEKIIRKHNPKNLFFPLGIGHADHKLLNAAGKRLNEKAFFYEDIPYTLNFELQDFSEFNFGESVMNHKIDLILDYETQLQGFLKLTSSKSIKDFQRKIIDHHKVDKIYIERTVEK